MRRSVFSPYPVFKASSRTFTARRVPSRMPSPTPIASWSRKTNRWSGVALICTPRHWDNPQRRVRIPQAARIPRHQPRNDCRNAPEATPASLPAQSACLHPPAGVTAGMSRRKQACSQVFCAGLRLGGSPSALAARRSRAARSTSGRRVSRVVARDDRKVGRFD